MATTMGSGETATASAAAAPPMQQRKPQSLTAAGWRKVNVVYYLSRGGGQMDPPHLLEGYLSPGQDGLRLKDVKKWLAALRGKSMPSSYAWSYKRSFKNGFIWHDLNENEQVIQPSGKTTTTTEYVLMGSEIIRAMATTTHPHPTSSSTYCHLSPTTTLHAPAAHTPTHIAIRRRPTSPSDAANHRSNGIGRSPTPSTPATKNTRRPPNEFRTPRPANPTGGCRDSLTTNLAGDHGRTNAFRSGSRSPTVRAMESQWSANGRGDKADRSPSASAGLMSRPSANAIRGSSTGNRSPSWAGASSTNLQNSCSRHSSQRFDLTAQKLIEEIKRPQQLQQQQHCCYSPSYGDGSCNNTTLIPTPDNYERNHDLRNRVSSGTSCGVMKQQRSRHREGDRAKDELGMTYIHMDVGTQTGDSRRCSVDRRSYNSSSDGDGDGEDVMRRSVKMMMKQSTTAAQESMMGRNDVDGSVRRSNYGDHSCTSYTSNNWRSSHGDFGALCRSAENGIDVDEAEEEEFAAQYSNLDLTDVERVLMRKPRGLSNHSRETSGSTTTKNETKFDYDGGVDVSGNDDNYGYRRSVTSSMMSPGAASVASSTGGHGAKWRMLERRRRLINVAAATTEGEGMGINRRSCSGAIPSYSSSPRPALIAHNDGGARKKAVMSKRSSYNTSIDHSRHFQSDGDLLHRHSHGHGHGAGGGGSSLHLLKQLWTTCSNVDVLGKNVNPPPSSTAPLSTTSAAQTTVSRSGRLSNSKAAPSSVRSCSTTCSCSVKDRGPPRALPAPLDVNCRHSHASSPTDPELQNYRLINSMVQMRPFGVGAGSEVWSGIPQQQKHGSCGAAATCGGDTTIRRPSACSSMKNTNHGNFNTSTNLLYQPTIMSAAAAMVPPVTCRRRRSCTSPGMHSVCSSSTTSRRSSVRDRGDNMMYIVEDNHAHMEEGFRSDAAIFTRRKGSISSTTNHMSSSYSGPVNNNGMNFGGQSMQAAKQTRARIESDEEELDVEEMSMGIEEEGDYDGGGRDTDRDQQQYAQNNNYNSKGSILQRSLQVQQQQIQANYVTTMNGRHHATQGTAQHKNHSSIYTDKKKSSTDHDSQNQSNQEVSEEEFYQDDEAKSSKSILTLQESILNEVRNNRLAAAAHAAAATTQHHTSTADAELLMPPLMPFSEAEEEQQKKKLLNMGKKTKKNKKEKTTTTTKKKNVGQGTKGAASNEPSSNGSFGTIKVNQSSGMSSSSNTSSWRDLFWSPRSSKSDQDKRSMKP